MYPWYQFMNVYKHIYVLKFVLTDTIKGWNSCLWTQINRFNILWLCQQNLTDQARPNVRLYIVTLPMALGNIGYWQKRKVYEEEQVMKFDLIFHIFFGITYIMIHA